MKLSFDHLESRLRAFFENRFPWLRATAAKHPAAQALMETLQASLEAGGGAPQIYVISMNPGDHTQCSHPEFLEELSGILEEAASSMGIPSIKPLVQVEPDISLSPGQFRIVTDPTSTHGETAVVESNSQSSISLSPDGTACLILPDDVTFPIQTNTLNIGRLEENDLVIPDQRISRRHAQIRYIHDRYVIFDLNSTGGTFVNGVRTESQDLNPGDVISLAGINLIFSSESASIDPDADTTNLIK